jgi:hypothetical protein
VIEPEEVRNNPQAFRCIGEEMTEMLDYSRLGETLNQRYLL